MADTDGWYGEQVFIPWIPRFDVVLVKNDKLCFINILGKFNQHSWLCDPMCWTSDTLLIKVTVVAFQDEPLPYGTISWRLEKVLKKYFSEEIVIHWERLFCIHYTTLLNFCLVIYNSINTQFIINLFNKKSK